MAAAEISEVTQEAAMAWVAGLSGEVKDILSVEATLAHTAEVIDLVETEVAEECAVVQATSTNPHSVDMEGKSPSRKTLRPTTNIEKRA